MENIIKVTNHRKQKIEDRDYWRTKTPEFRLDALEILRLEAGKFLYAYPARFQRVITVTRKAQN